MKNAKVIVIALITNCLLFIAAHRIDIDRQDRKDHFLRERKKIFGELRMWMDKNHAHNSYPLSLIAKVPKESTEESSGIFLKGVMTLSRNKTGQLILADTILNRIIIMDPKEVLLKEIGRSGQAPGELMQPMKAFSNDGLIFVFELGNMRIQTFEEDGTYRGGFRLFKTYTAIERINDGCFYAAPAVRDSRTALVDLLSEEGQLLSTFGECLRYGHDMRSINLDNSISLSTNERGDLWLAFKHYPIIRSYSKDGKLLREFSIDHPIMNRQASENRGGGKILSGQNAPARIIVTNALRFFDRKIFILRTHPCLEILEVDLDGRITGIYYWEEDFSYSSLDFLVMNLGGKIEFYVFNLETQKVDIFREKEKRQ